MAACGRSILLFSVSQRKLIHKEDSCLPPSLKINSLEIVSESQFLIVSDRTFAVYDLGQESSNNNAKRFQLAYYHGS